MTFELWPSKAANVCVGEREEETTGTRDDRGNRRRMCFCRSTDNVILQMTFSSN